MTLSEHLIVARPNPTADTLAHEHATAPGRAAHLLLGGLAACRRGELEKSEWHQVDLDATSSRS